MNFFCFCYAFFPLKVCNTEADSILDVWMQTVPSFAFLPMPHIWVNNFKRPHVPSYGTGRKFKSHGPCLVPMWESAPQSHLLQPIQLSQVPLLVILSHFQTCLQAFSAVHRKPPYMSIKFSLCVYVPTLLLTSKLNFRREIVMVHFTCPLNLWCYYWVSIGNSFLFLFCWTPLYTLLVEFC